MAVLRGGPKGNLQETQKVQIDALNTEKSMMAGTLEHPGLGQGKGSGAGLGLESNVIVRA